MKRITLGNKRREETPANDTKVIRPRQEVIGKRSRHAKHYRNDNGTYTMELNARPVHYYNKATKQFEEIINEFCEEDNLIKVKSSENNISFVKDKCQMNLSKDNHHLTFNYQTNNSVKAKYHQNQLTYSEVLPNVDFEYIITDTGIKENIIVKCRLTKYEYTFELKTSLIPHLSNDNKILELSDKNGVVQFMIPTPIMIDNNDNQSNEVYYEFEYDEEDKLMMKIIADSEWINANDRAFPVKIDPMVIFNEVEEQINNYSVEDNKIYKINTSSMELGGRQVPVIPEGEPLDITKEPEFVLYSYTHLISIKAELLKSLSLLEAKIKFKYTGTTTLQVTVSSYDEVLSTNQLIVNYPIKQNSINMIEKKAMVNDLSISFLERLNSYLNGSGNNFMLHLKSNLLNKQVITDLPIIEITYKADGPQDFIETNKSMIVEDCTGISVGIEKNIKNGILTTYINQETNKVYQHFQAATNLYLRENIDTNNWGEWTKIANIQEVKEQFEKINYSYSNGILSITNTEEKL